MKPAYSFLTAGRFRLEAHAASSSGRALRRFDDDDDDDERGGLQSAGQYGAIFAFYYVRKWRTRGREAPWRRPRRSVCCRAVRSGAASAVVLALVSSAMYHNMTLTVGEGADARTMRVKEHMAQFANTQLWGEVRQFAGSAWQEVRAEGLFSLLGDMWRAMDEDGTRHAGGVLGVPATADADEVKRAYRRLAREWHPDKNPERREEAELRMQEINEAYETFQTAHRKQEMRDSVHAEAEASRAAASERRAKRAEAQHAGGRGKRKKRR